MKKILVSFGLILTLVLCCALVPVNAAEECAHEKVTFQYFLEGQAKPTTCEESGIAKYTCDSCKASVYKKEVGNHVIEFDITDASCTESQKVIEKCSVCETVVKETEVAPALGHNWKETVVEASCDLPSGIASKCTRCDAKKEFAAFEEGSELYAPAKGHFWVDTKDVKATCKEGGYTLQTCANCLEEQKVNLTEKDTENGHKPVVISVLKEPACQTNGIGKYACELCEEELGYRSIAAAHKWDEANMEVIEAPTCGKPGKGNLTCALCDAKKENVEISNAGIEHILESVVVSESCTEGAKVGQKCTVCDFANLYPVEESKPLGHDWEEEFKAASCDKASGIEKTCKACDAVEFVEFEEGHELYVAAKGHKEAEIKAVAPTCAAEGLTAGVKCSVCNTVLVKQEKVAKDPEAHTPELLETLKAATCTTNGVGKYACKDCKKDLGYKSIPAAHVLGELVVDTAATCAKEGKGHKVCTLCDYVEKDIVIKKADHTYVEKAIDATCTEPAKVGKECSVCKAQKDVTVVKDSKPLGHKLAESYVAASCTDPSGILVECERCDHEQFKPFTEADGELYVAAKGHKEVEIKAVAPTCSKTGLTAGVKCSVCNVVLVKQEEVAKDPEAHTEELVDTLKAETCTTNGVGKYACKDCEKELGYKSIPAAHKLGELVVDTAATCAKEGKGHKVCTVCDYIEKDIVIKKADHTYVEKAIDATCTEPAKVGKECSVCKAQKDVTVVKDSKPLGHKLAESYVAASCTDPSGILVECERCDHEQFKPFTEADGELYVAAKGHKEAEIKAVAATCAKTGLTAGVKCSVCNVVLVKQEEVAKDPEAHTEKLVATLKAETCTTSGVGKYACKDCDADLGYKAIPAAHKLGEIVVETAATCGKDGKGHKECTACDYVEKDIVIKATGEHNYVTKAIDATCTEPAKVGEECSACKAQKDVTVVKDSKPLGHKLVEKYVAASCTDPSGILAECERCDYEKLTAFTEADGELYVAAKGHKEAEIKAVAATCAKTGLTAGVKCSVCNVVLVKQEEVAKNPNAHTEKLVATLKAETCTTSGVGKYACKDCDADLGYKAIPAAHKLGELVVDTAATCGKDGKGHKECTACDYVQKDIVIKATGEHTMVADTIIDATCTTPSRVGTICSTCGKEDKDVVSVGEANGHDWKETPVEATCTTPAGVQKECKVCKAKEFEAYTGELAEAAKGHNYEAVVVEGTCKTAGYTADVCKTCKDVQNKVEGAKNPENHTPKADTVIKEATCTTTGVAKSVCKDCGASLGYVAIAAGHSFAEEAKATEDGTLVYVECEDCDAIKAVAYFGKKEVALGTVFESLAKYQEAEAAE